MRDVFEDIYDHNKWGHGSGAGSLPRHTQGYVGMLQDFIREHDIESVVDLGCGDWQFSRFVNWDGVQYHGLDLVRSVIDRNKARYSAPNIEFRVFSGDFDDLPEAELLLAKDVLQHWSNESVKSFLPTLKRYRYSLITNCVNPRGETENIDIEDGEYRYLDIRLPPFDVDATEYFSFTNSRPFPLRYLKPVRWLKRVLLVKPQN
ncbi:MAG: class I SAM-dependent methyltransferase [Woeseia sp.]